MGFHTKTNRLQIDFTVLENDYNINAPRKFIAALHKEIRKFQSDNDFADLGHLKRLSLSSPVIPSKTLGSDLLPADDGLELNLVKSSSSDSLDSDHKQNEKMISSKSMMLSQVQIGAVASFDDIAEVVTELYHECKTK